MDKIISLDRKNKTLQVKHGCLNCVHIKVCKFHQEIKNVAKTNMMYEMNEYLEHNNILQVFETHRRCSHYNAKETYEKDTSPTLKFHDFLLKQIVQYYVVDHLEKEVLKESYPNHIDNLYFFFHPDISVRVAEDEYDVVLKTTDKEIGHGTVVYSSTKKISELLKDWKFI